MAPIQEQAKRVPIKTTSLAGLPEKNRRNIWHGGRSILSIPTMASVPKFIHKFLNNSFFNFTKCISSRN